MLLNCGVGLLRVPWTARKSNQSILKEISPEYSLEELMLKLKLQYFGHLMWRADSFEKTLMEIEGERRGWQRMRLLDGITDSTGMSLSKSGSWWWTGKPGVLQFMGSQRVWHDWATELNWTEAKPGGASGEEYVCPCRRHERCSRFNPWVRKVTCRRTRQPTPVFLPGESQGQRILADYSPWGHKELDITDWAFTERSNIHAAIPIV